MGKPAAAADDRVERLRAAVEPADEPRTFTSERTSNDVAAVIELALRTNETGGGGARRRAGLHHRAAWLARALHDETTERAHLEQTVAAYLDVFEHDSGLGPDTAIRVAYLLGDLSARLGLTDDARRWLLECTRMEGAGQQAGLLRMARERLEELRDGGKPAARSA
ncbi:MAG: DUF2225 domain-containing protein [Dehalococcoidia bacterium]|nr:DUF2225 domain-containing protein [Dehalococcoidia bacterium]